MRTLLRYVLITSIIVGLAWGAFAVRINGRTLYGHLRSSSEEPGSILARIKAELDERLGGKVASKDDKGEKRGPPRAPDAAETKPRSAAKPRAASQAEEDRRAESLREAAAKLAQARTTETDGRAPRQTSPAF